MKKIFFLMTFSLGMLVPTIAQNIPSYVPTNGLVGWWPFNGNANDESGNGLNGVNHGAVQTTDRKGKPNSAYIFFGSEWIECPFNPILNVGEGSFTLSCWATKKGGNTFQHFITKNEISEWPNATTSYALRYQGPGIAMYASGDANNSNGSIATNALNNLSTWNHFVGVYNAELGTISIYVNGALSISVTNNPNPQNYNNNGGLFFGVEHPTVALPSGPQFLEGKLDDIAIYNRSLTQEEITALYTSTPCTPPTAVITPKSTTNIKENETVVLAATQGNGYSYEWYKDGIAIPNAIDSNYTATTPGNYTVKISTSQTCDSTSAAITVKRIYTLPTYLPTNGLVAWYPFNGNANDESGNANHGTVNGTTLTSGKNGELNKAYSFDGINDGITFPLNVSNYSISFWVNFDQLTNQFSELYYYNDSYCELLQNNNSVYVRKQNSNNQNNLEINTASISPNNWHHIYIYYDQSLNTLNCKINNQNIYTSSLKADGIANNLNNNLLYLGARGWNNTNFFRGNLDDIAIYNRALTQQEITALYNSCTPPTAVITPKSTTNIKENESVVLAATKGNGYSYEWYKDGIAIPNAIDSNYTATSPGNYTVKITTSQTCDSTSAAIAVKRIYTLPTYLPTNGLVGWWPFNGNANDESGNGNNGTVNGATLTTDRNNTLNEAFLLNGNSNISVDKAFFNNGWTEYTTNIWVNLSTINSSNTFLNTKPHCGLALGYSYLGNNKIYHYKGADPINNSVACWNVFNQDLFNYNSNFVDQWMMITISKQNNNYTYYVNGKIDKTQLVTTNTLNGLCSMTFGSVSNGTEFMTGKIDDFGIWNRTLTQQEITALYVGEACSTPIATATAQSATSFCQGSSVNLSAATNANYTYQWLNNGVTISNATAATYKATTAGKYSVIVKNNTGCVDTSSTITVAVTSLATPIITGPATLCYNSKAIFKASIAGGTWGVVNDYMLLSSPQGLFRNNKMPPTNLYKTGVKYTLTSKDKSCSVTAQKSVWIRNVAATSVTLTASKQTLKVGEEVAATATTKIIGNGIYWMSASTSFVSVTGVSPYIALIKGLRPATGANITFSVDDAAKGCRNAAFLPFTVTAASSMVTSDATQQMATTGLHTYPNPSNGSLYIENLGDATSIKLVDVTGRTLQTNSVIADRMQLDYKHIVKGNYFIHVQGNETNEVKAITIE